NDSLAESGSEALVGVGPQQPGVVMIGRGAEDLVDLARVDRAVLHPLVPDGRAEHAGVVRAGLHQLRCGVVGSGEARLAPEVGEPDRGLRQVVLRHQPPGGGGLAAERERVAGKLAQAGDIGNGLETAAGAGDETLWNLSSMSRCATGLAPGTCNRACAPVSPPKQAR